MPITVVPFVPEHLEPAAALLAARHRVDQGRVFGLPPAFGDSAVALPALEALLGTPATDGWVALADGRLAGFLIGKCQLFADTNLLAAFFDARAVMIPFVGYAADPEMADAVYRALYAVAAARWVEAGFFSHSIGTTSDPEGAAPWFSFGFGQRLASGIRVLDDAPRATASPSLPAPFTARRARPADGDAVHRVIADLVRFHGDSPIFLPQAGEASYAACVVDWFTTNPLSSRFWPRRGFVPFAARLERRIDPRVAWARA
jgi:hypothetical protein